ncbi:hypothetical protein PVAP13_1NG305219 [Panicum virgatum]|uniref:Uncharacterized protein n=1 Tax=Panicum virgatum TaxID=38727 RepID=A0A8T0X2Z2_PANVG|nr:hypothetical protein PVAP13_1NG305219 [Panicum virgatum]
MHIHFPFIDIIRSICVAFSKCMYTIIIICCCQLTDPFFYLQNMIQVFNSKMYVA